jgi:hypothetical protein
MMIEAAGNNNRGLMTTAEQEKAFDAVLTACLARTVDFVKMAEAKNAALLAFASAWIVAIVNLLSGKNALPLNYGTALIAALPLFAITAILCIASFLPRMLRHFHRPQDNSKNLLFFGDVSSFEVAVFRERISERYMPAEGHSFTTSYLDDLCVQISVNSKIAVRKFKFFNGGAGAIIVAIALLALPPLCWTFELLGILLNTLLS